MKKIIVGIVIGTVILTVVFTVPKMVKQILDDNKDLEEKVKEWRLNEKKSG